MRKHVDEFLKLVGSLDLVDISAIAKMLVDSDLILVAGNGGSYANATHIAGDLSANTKLFAITHAIGDNLVSFSALSNDNSYSEAMALDAKRWCGPKSTLILLSTSGRSPNIIALANLGKKLGSKVVSMVGAKPDESLVSLSDHFIRFDSQDAGLIESVYGLIGHLLVKQVNVLLDEGVAQHGE